MLVFDTKNQTFRQIMGNGLKYSVPRFQRDYSWTQSQWHDLWQDIVHLGTSSEKPRIPHYMGYLVLQSADNKNFTIIDGQQRLTTISIIILAALYRLKNLKGDDEQKNTQRIATLMNSFIGSKNPVSLQVENKLTLNRNNKNFFESYLSRLRQPPVRKIKYSEKLTGEALEYFKDKLFKECQTGESIAKKIESIVDHLIFTTLTVPHVANAYTVFETLNARGVQLSTPDLVKNYLFSLIDDREALHEQEIEQLERQWSRIIEQLERHQFSQFIRVDWNSRNNFTRKSDLFKTIRECLNTKTKACQYLDVLEEHSEVYAALQDDNDDFWKRYQGGVYNKQSLKLSLKTLKLFNIKTPHSVLLSAFDRFNPGDFIQFLRHIEAITMRYNIICGERHGDQEKIYSQVACKIKNLKDSYYKTDILKGFKEIYPSDEDFVHKFSIKQLKTRQTSKKARYLLYRIENHISGGKKPDLDYLSVEHILPVHPTESWIKKFENADQMEDYMDRIGNLTLLSQADNKQLSRLDFNKKKQHFAQSTLHINRKCAEYDVWNEHSILQNQKWLAEQARQIWKLPPG